MGKGYVERVNVINIIEKLWHLRGNNSRLETDMFKGVRRVNILGEIILKWVTKKGSRLETSEKAWVVWPSQREMTLKRLRLRS